MPQKLLRRNLGWGGGQRSGHGPTNKVLLGPGYHLDQQCFGQCFGLLPVGLTTVHRKTYNPDAQANVSD